MEVGPMGMAPFLTEAGFDAFAMLQLLIMLPEMVRLKKEKDAEREKRAKGDGKLRIIRSNNTGFFTRSSVNQSGKVMN